MKIAILTSGGDAPGMNSMIINIIEQCAMNKYQVVVVRDGYKGLVNNDFYDVDNHDIVRDLRWNAGSWIGSSRYPDFKNQIDIAINNLKNNAIDYLCVIGGNGSYEGAKLINNFVPTFFLPATIDNDVWFSDYCLGFMSTINEIVMQTQKIESTFKTHKNVVFIEIMGRHCNDLLDYCYWATLPSLAIRNDKKLSKEEIVKKIKGFYNKNGFAVILVIELMYSQNEIKETLDYINNSFECQSRWQVLGYSQRGANVCAMDMHNAAKLSQELIKLVNNNEKVGYALYFDGNKIKYKKYDEIEQK